MAVRQRRASSTAVKKPNERAVKPISLLLAWKVARAVHVPVIGAGGIESAADALEYILAGAAAFQIGSVILSDRQSPSDILEGLKTYMQDKRYRSLSDVVGRAGRQEDSSG